MPEDTYMIPAESTEIRMFRDPKQVLGEAALVGNAVDALVRKKPELVKVISGRRHPRFELLQIVGNMFRVTARARETRPVQFGDVEGWECDAEAYHIPTGQVVATAQSMCLNDEDNWSTRSQYEFIEGKKVNMGVVPVPSFQRRSMAQTRACSKALRLAIGWVLGMAGYETTPAEEVNGTEAAHEPEQHQQPQRKTNGNGTLISEPQMKRMFALGNSVGKSREAIGVILAAYNFTDPAAVTRDKYEAICAEIMRRD